MEEGSSGGSGSSDSNAGGSGGVQQRELERMAEVLVTGEQLRLRLHEEKVIKDRRHHLKTYPNCFVAKELIDWLIEHKEASDRETAIKLMQKLADRGIIHHELFSGAGEMAQQLRALTALLKILSSNPSNHMVAHNHPK